MPMRSFPPKRLLFWRRFVARLKQFRRIATRYDKLDIRFEAYISIAATLIWLA